MEVTGVISVLNKVESVSDGKYVKRLFVLETEEEYNNVYAFDAFGEKTVDQTNGLKVGDTVTVEFNIRTNEYQGKYYTSLSPWKITKEGSSQSKAPVSQEAAFEAEVSDDLPF